MSAGDWIGAGGLLIAALSLTVAAIALSRNKKRDGVEDVKAFTRLETKLDGISGDVKNMGRSVEKATDGLNACMRDIALLKQSQETLESKLEQHLQTHPPNISAIKRTRTTKKEGE